MDQSKPASLRAKAASGASWTSLEGIFNQFANLIILVLLARLIEPDQFGLLAMLGIFIALSQALLDGGFGSALIQKQKTSLLDESSVFYFNLLLGFLLAILLCLTSPLIAIFYRQPILLPLTCLMATVLVIQPFAVVQRSLLSKRLEFRSQVIASMTAITISGLVGVGMAAAQYGVWALASMQISRTLILTIVYWIISPWRPTPHFSVDSLRNLFSFGSQMMIATMLSIGYHHIHAAVIGRYFSATELGYYSKGGEMAAAPGKAISAAITRIAFPLLAQVQNDPQRLINAMRRGFRISALISFPSAFGLAAVADNLVPFILTEKWIEIVPILQLLTIGGALLPLSVLHISSLKAIGRSDLILRLELIKKLISIISLVVTIPFGLFAIVVGRAIASILNNILNGYYTSKVFGYSCRDQLGDLLPLLLSNLMMATFVLIVGAIMQGPPWLILSVQVSVGIIAYLLFASIIHTSSSQELLLNVNSLLKRKARSH